MPLQPYTVFDPSTGRPLLQPEEEITFTADQTRLFLRPNKDEGPGTLYVTNQHVIWQSLDHTRGYTFDYPYILLHAVCRDTSSFPHPCLYAQLDEELDEQQEEMGVTQRHEEEEEDTMEEQGEGKEEEDAADQESDVITEMRFVPENPQILDALWSAMSACAALNPDEDAGDDDGEGEEGDFLFDANEISAGLAAMRSGDNMVDAEEMAEGGENVDAYDDAEGEDGRYDDADEEEAAAEQHEAEQPQSNSRKPAASKPDDAAQVQQQLASATAQVQAASTDAKSSSTAARAKRERQEEEQPASAQAALK